MSWTTRGRGLVWRALVAVPAAACTVVLAAAPETADAAPCAAAGYETSRLTDPQEARALRCVINKTRVRRGRKPVRTSAVLDVAALVHSASMLATGCFEHQCPGEPTLGARVQSAGFPDCNCPWRAAENIAYGTAELSRPRVVVRAWMNSRAHRRVLLDPQFRLIGIGILPGTPRAPLNLSGATFTIELGWMGKPV